MPAFVLPVARRLMQPAQAAKASADGYLAATVLHDISHGLGPLFSRQKGKQVEINEAIGPASSSLEEAKAYATSVLKGDPNAFEKNDGNFWVFEGLGTYFETLVTEPDGSLQVGGVVGSRMERAVERLVHGRELIPTSQLVRVDQRGFNEGDVFLKYQEANALTVFLMQAEDEKYREGFLDYVRDAAQGRLKRATGRSLEDRLGVPHAQIDEELISYLKNAAPMKGD